MELLQGLDIGIAVFLHIQDALCGGSCTGDGGHVGDPALDRSLSEIAVVVDTVLADRGVDDQVNVAVRDEVEKYFSQFNRYTFVENNKESILDILSNYSNNGIPDRKPLKQFSPDVIARQLLESD